MQGRDEPSQSKPCGFASSPEGGAFCHLPVSTNKAPPSGELANEVRLRGFALEGAGTATAVTEGVVFFFFLENATFLQKKLQFFLEKGRFPIDSLVIIGV